MPLLVRSGASSRRRALPMPLSAALGGALLILCATTGAVSADEQLVSAAPPTIEMGRLQRVAPHVLIAADRSIPLVPNIGIIEGEKAILVVDSGLGPGNGARVYEAARRIAKRRKIWLTTTHFHPEHSFGASAFPAGDVIMNQRQADELADKGSAYLARFREIGAEAQAALVGTRIVPPGVVYLDRLEIDLGGVSVELREMPAHTRGDQIIFVPNGRVLFTGDLAETNYFPVLIDDDSNGARWIEVLRHLALLRPSIVVPGHGETTDGRLLDDVRGMLDWMQAEVRTMAAAGMSVDAMTGNLQAQAQDRYPAWKNGQYLGYNILALYNEALAERAGK